MAEVGALRCCGWFYGRGTKVELSSMGMILKSWKEIARHLKAGVRTVQRWESKRGMPVYRAGGTRRAPVLAYRAELDAWLHSRGDGKDRARYGAENTRQAVARHGVLLKELTQLMHAQGLMIAGLTATQGALNKFCPALANGASAKNKYHILGPATKTRAA
jgi:excisionase family DNA binding protein